MSADIPMLADLILRENSAPPKTAVKKVAGLSINLVGIAVGNGCWGSAVGLCSFGPDMYRVWHQFLYGHSAISTESFQRVNSACGDAAAGPGAWSNCSGQGAQCSNMLRGSERFQSDECQTNLSMLRKDEYPGNCK